MTFINWDNSFFLDPETLTPAAWPFPEDTSEFIPAPTYGNNGGANYSQGDFGENPFDPITPGEEPVDALDEWFLLHDRLSFLAGGNPASQVAADLTLVGGILGLNGGELADPEASLYAGLATLAMIERVVASGQVVPSMLLFAAAADAYQNLSYGLAGVLANPEERDDLVAWLADVGNALPFSGTETLLASSDQSLFAVAADQSVPATNEAQPSLAMLDAVPDLALAHINTYMDAAWLV
jgi:hypothetical protein